MGDPQADIPAAVLGTVTLVRYTGFTEPDRVGVHPGDARRAADLDALRDYVRVLADRMGLRDWTFEVHEVPGTYFLGLCQMEDMDEDRRFADLLFTPAFFGARLEDRRFELVRELIRCHTEEFACHAANSIDLASVNAGGPGFTVGGHEFDAQHDRARARIAAAWAPALPLPLVGLMRPLRGARKDAEKIS
jgi:hypothetical protein